SAVGVRRVTRGKQTGAPSRMPLHWRRRRDSNLKRRRRLTAQLCGAAGAQRRGGSTGSSKACKQGHPVGCPCTGGGGGIRTPGYLAASSVFKTDAIDHSATPPRSPTT